MKANFSYYNGLLDQEEMDKTADWLCKYGEPDRGSIGGRITPEGFESFYCVDVLGSEFVWMNESFPKEHYTWYHWFESVFLVPEDMYLILVLRWK